MHIKSRRKPKATTPLATTAQRQLRGLRRAADHFRENCPEWCTVWTPHTVHEGRHQLWVDANDPNHEDQAVHLQAVVFANQVRLSGETAQPAMGLTMIRPDSRMLNQTSFVMSSWDEWRSLAHYILAQADYFQQDNL